MTAMRRILFLCAIVLAGVIGLGGRENRQTAAELAGAPPPVLTRTASYAPPGSPRPDRQPQQPPTPSDAVPLDRAVRDGKVEVKIHGLGGSTGDAILITVRRKTPQVLHLALTPGTVFQNVSGKVQNMLGASIKGERVSGRSYRPGSEITLTDNDKHDYIVEAYCLDFHKGNPRTSDTFSLAAPDEMALLILQVGKKRHASMRAIQAALWVYRDRVSAPELTSKFPVSDADLRVAWQILREIANSKTGKPKR